MADITMPQLGETVTEGTITKWHKQVGDAIAEDEVLFEVSTDKVDSEVPSPVSGTVDEILVAEGETVNVGTKLAVIASGAGAGAAADGSAALAPDEVGVQPEEQEAQADEPPPSAEVANREQVNTASETSGTVRRSSGQGGQAPARPPSGGTPRPGARPADQRPPSGPSQSGPSKLLSPVVRRLIAENGLDPARIAGTGAGGRITRDDVLAAIDLAGTGRASTAGPANGGPANGGPANGGPANGGPANGGPANGDLANGGLANGDQAGTDLVGTGPATNGQQNHNGNGIAATAGTGQRGLEPAGPVPTAGDRDTVVPFTNIRRRTAEHMVRSKATSAHTMVAVEVDYSGVEKVRRAERERFKAAEGFSLTYLPFIARAVVDALEEWPYLNSSVGDDELIVHGEVHLGVAVDLDFEGLLVPVVHRAEERRLVALAREISGLASRARSKRLTMDDISGGTFTLTNAGSFGTFITVPVINQPQVAILSTDGVRKKPVAVSLPDGGDGIAVHPVGNLVMSWDHRAVDGAYAAAFMAKVRDILETRDWSSEL